MKVEVVMKYLAEKLGLSQSHQQQVRTYTWISNGRFISCESIIIKHPCIYSGLYLIESNYEVFDKSIMAKREGYVDGAIICEQW